MRILLTRIAPLSTLLIVAFGTYYLNAGEELSLQKIKDNLKYGAPELRIEAVRKAQKLNANEALSVWLLAIDDENPTVRREAIELLSGRKFEPAYKIFEKAVHDTDEDVRLEAVRILGHHVSAGATGLLLTVYKDKVPGKAREEAGQLLLERQFPQAGETFLSTVGDDAPEIRAIAARGIIKAKTASDFGPKLLELLSDSVRRVRTAAAQAAGEVKYSGAVPELLRMLESGLVKETESEEDEGRSSSYGYEYGSRESYPESDAAAAALAQIDIKFAVLANYSGQERVAAARLALGEGECPEIETLMALLAEQEGGKTAAKAISLCKNSDVVTDLIFKLGKREDNSYYASDSDWRMRENSAVALGQIGAAEAAQAVIQSANTDRMLNVSNASALALAKMWSKFDEPLKTEAAQAILSAWERETKYYEENESDGKCSDACDALGVINADSVHQDILNSANSGKSMRRQRAVYVLGEMGRESDVSVLLGMYTDSDKQLGAAVVQALAAMRPSITEKSITEKIASEDTSEKIAALKLSLRLQIVPATSTIKEQMSHSDPEVRIAALEALAGLKSLELIPYIHLLLEDTDTGVRQYLAILVMKAHAGQATRFFVDGVKKAFRENPELKSFIKSLPEKAASICAEPVPVEPAEPVTSEWEQSSEEKKSEPPTNYCAPVIYLIGDSNLETPPSQIIAFLKNRDCETRRAAAYSLGEKGRVTELRALEVARQDYCTADMAKTAIARIKARQPKLGS